MENPETPSLPTDLQLLSRFADAARDVFLITEAKLLDRPGPRVVYVNAAFTRMTGYKPEEIIGKTPRILQGPDTDRETLLYMRGKLERWEPFRVELLNHRKDGTPFWVEIDGQPLADSTGRFTHWVAVQRDITERKAAEKRILMEHFALAQVSDAVIAVDEDRRVTYWNGAATRLYGVPATEALGKPLASIYGQRWPSPGAEAEAMAELGESHQYRGEFLHILPDGRELPVECSISLLRDAFGKPRGYVDVIRDISDRKKAQESLAKSRQILREVLWTATNRGLVLCDTQYELPSPLQEKVAMVDIAHPSDLRRLRHVYQDAAQAAGLTHERTENMVLALHEGAMNALVHARGGTVSLHVDRTARKMQGWISDTGGGIDTDLIHRATLERGFTTSGGFGHGFPMMLSLADQVYLLSDYRGTTVVVELSELPPDPSGNAFP